MFSLPSLGLFSSPAAASISFKTDKANGLARLYSEHVPPTDHRFYASILAHFHSAPHLFDTFSIKDARAIRDRQPENFKALVQLLTAHLDSLKSDPQFAAAPDHATTGLAAGLGKWVSAPLSPLTTGLTGSYRGQSSAAAAPRDRTREALNCARLLTRLLPVLMEDSGKVGQLPADTFASPLEEELLWSRKPSQIASQLQADPLAGQASSDSVTAPQAETVGDQTEDQFVIEDDEDDDRSENVSLSSPQKQRKDPLNGGNSSSEETAKPSIEESAEHLPTLAEKLLALCVDFLFFPGFTLPFLPDDDDHNSTPDGFRVHFAIWEKGIGSSVGLEGTTRQHVAHRVELLRLLLVLLSKSVYVPPPAQKAFRDRALEFACTSLSRTVTLPILCSLLNSACSPDSASGWNLPVLGGGASSEGEGGKETLRALSLQLLAVFFEWQPVAKDASGTLDASSDSGLKRPEPSRNLSTASGLSSTQPTTLGANQFSYWLSKLHRVSDLDLLSSSLFNLLRPAANTLLSLPIPGASSNFQGVYLHSPEAMTLLWHLLRSNAKFRAFVLDDSVRAPVLLATLLSHALLGKDSPPSHGIVRLALFVLQDVSAYPAFAKHISKVGSAAKCKLPSKFSALANGSSSAADVLISSSYTLLTTKGMGTSGLGVYPVILITLANCSTHFLSLSIPSATRIGLLLTQFSSPSFLLADEGHPRCLYFLLETINGVLLHQARANHNLVYTVLGKNRELARLRRFTLRRALAEVRRRSGLSKLSANAPSASALSSPAAEIGGSSGSPLRAGGTTGGKSTPVAQSKPEGDHDPTSENAGEGKAEQEDGAPKVPSEKALGKARRASDTKIDKPEAEGMASSSSNTPSARPVPTTPQRPSDADDEERDEWVSKLDDGELYAAAAQVGRNGFVPMEDWVSSWATNLPLAPLVQLHEGLFAEMELLCSSEAVANRNDADQRVLAWLREQDVAALFRKGKASGGLGSDGDENDQQAAMPPAQTRPFRWTEQVSIWLLSYIWGAIYVTHLPLAVWPPEGMKLFYLVNQQTQQAQKAGAQGGGGGGGGIIASSASAIANPFGVVTSAFNAFGFGGTGGTERQGGKAGGAGEGGEQGARQGSGIV